MCMNAEYGLTMAGLLDDPLIRLMNSSDGISDRAHADLWERTRETVIARVGGPAPWCSNASQAEGNTAS